MKKWFASLILILFAFQFTLPGIQFNQVSTKKIVTATKRLYLPGCQGAYNPSMIKYNDGYLMTFRYVPNRSGEPWISHIGVVLLDEAFEPISEIELLDTRLYNNTTPSQAEDARIFSHNNKFYVIYNDNMDLTFPSFWERRDMYIAELLCIDHKFTLAEPLRLIHGEKYRHTLWQKNWSPFEWEGKLMLSYMINPHEVIDPNLVTGNCQRSYLTHKPIMWGLGSLRGGTPAQLVNGEYLAFFHSGIVTKTSSSDHKDLWHYFMGAYTFSAEPPFELTSASAEPIDHPSFYTYSNSEKRVIYPGGFAVDGSTIYVIYGKDDCEVWIATIDFAELKNSMVSVR